MYDLRYVLLYPYEVTLLWNPPLAPNGEVIGYTITYIGTKDNNPPDHLEEPIRLNANEYRHRLQNLTDGYTYVLEVRLTQVFIFFFL